VLGGHVDITADGSAWAPEVDAGQLRLLATWGDARSVRWPNVPTVRESGVDVVASSQYGLAGPKGMDNAVVKILHDAFKQGLETPAHIAVLRGLGQEPAYLNSSDYRAFIVREMEERRSLGR
jgi:tripartite-type tricarboxylate transporter receptor subunit TctC